MQRGDTPKCSDVAWLNALVTLAAMYLAGRALLPLAGHDAVEGWRLAIGLPVFAGAAIVLLRRARHAPDPSPWLLLAAGALLFPLGTVLATVAGTSSSAPPSAHAAWLSFYLCSYLALGRLAHAALRPFPSAFLLDGVASVLTLGAAVSFLASAAGIEGYRVWEAALGLAYPALDLVLLGYTLWIIAVTPRPVAELWRRLAAAWALLLVCDGIFVGLGAAQELSAIAVYTAGYPVVMVLLARATAAPLPEPVPLELDTRTALAVPATVLAVLLAVLAGVAVAPTDGPAVPLIALALVVLAARVVLIQRVASRLAETRRFERGFDEAGVGMGIADVAGRWTRVNPALCEILGCDADALVGSSVLAQVEGDHQAAVRALRAQLLRGAGHAEPVHLRVAAAGDARDILVTGNLVTGAGPAQFFVQVRDVTAERRSRRHADVISAITREALALDDLPELLERVVPQLAQAVEADLVVWLPLDEADPAVASPAPIGAGVLDDLRAGGSILLGGRREAGVEIDDVRAIEVGLPYLHRRGLQYVALTRVQPRAAGRAVLCVAHRRRPARPAEQRTCLDTVANVLATAADRAHDERASRHRALHDPLTGLANRALLSAHLGHAIASARRDGGSVAVLLIDLDRFKLVNDTLGHEVGDALLRACADRLGRHTRDGDLLARLGGDEFVLVVARPGDPRDVERAAARIVAALDAPIEIGGRELRVGASTGVALMAASVATPEALLREADQAMYRAKRAGGGRWSRADEGLRTHAEPRADIERDLRSAVDEERLRLALQPRLSLTARRLTGYEALVRWARPGHGLVFPDGFVPLAATVGLLGPIGDWVLARSLRFLAGLPETEDEGEPPRVAVNLLPAQVTAALPERIDRHAADAGIATRRLHVEIPATLLVTDDAAMDVVQRLRGRGATVGLEDFGTGWTSLAGLQRHPVDELKLDRALIARLPESAAARSIARATVRVAEELGMGVSAAGVESLEQLAAVRDLGIDLVQGHLIAPPLAAEDAAGFAQARAWESLLAG